MYAKTATRLELFGSWWGGENQKKWFYDGDVIYLRHGREKPAY